MDPGRGWHKLGAAMAGFFVGWVSERDVKREEEMGKRTEGVEGRRGGESP